MIFVTLEVNKNNMVLNKNDVEGNLGNQAFPEIPRQLGKTQAFPEMPRQLRKFHNLTTFIFWEAAQH